MGKDGNGKDQPPQPRAQLAILATITVHPETGQLGLAMNPGISDHEAFLLALSQLVHEGLTREFVRRKGQESPIIKPPPPAVLRPGP